MPDVVLIRDPAKHGPELRPDEGSAWIFDASLEEIPYESAEITQHPVEGRDVTDHIRREPVRLTISGLITSTPLHLQADAPDRDRRLHQELVELMNRRVVMTVVTGLQVYENMAIARIETPRMTGQGQVLYPRVEFQEVAFVEQEDGQIPDDLLAQFIRPRAGRTQRSAQPTEETDATDADRVRDNRSVLAALADRVFGGGS